MTIQCDINALDKRCIQICSFLISPLNHVVEHIYSASNLIWCCNNSTFMNTACWVKNSADDILKYFSNFSKKTGFAVLCKLSQGDNLHEMFKPISWENKEKISSRCHLLNFPRMENVKALDNITNFF